jgi:hypothetical protein
MRLSTGGAERKVVCTFVCDDRALASMGRGSKGNGGDNKDQGTLKRDHFCSFFFKMDGAVKQKRRRRG